jgi:hypothetical protein
MAGESVSVRDGGVADTPLLAFWPMFEIMTFSTAVDATVNHVLDVSALGPGSY